MPTPTPATPRARALAAYLEELPDTISGRCAICNREAIACIDGLLANPGLTCAECAFDGRDIENRTRAAALEASNDEIEDLAAEITEGLISETRNLRKRVASAIATRIEIGGEDIATADARDIDRAFAKAIALLDDVATSIFSMVQNPEEG